MITTQQRLTTALADRYRVERELGAGGMATVYLAHDLRHERDVAIKVLHPDLGAVLGAERFLAEIKTTAKLQHPHILPLLDSGAADGLLYYVMPYVRGETLRTRLERDTQLAIPDAVRLASEVADAIDHAHKQGVIHRDIKPENILLQDGHALVADFGIALAVQQAGGQRMTQTGLSLGTPQYMSPEQATGEKVVDARSDLYALAAVTYEMLTGAPPFTGASVQAIMARVMTSEPEPPSRVRKTIPGAVEAAVLQGLAKLPADRFASARDFAQALTGEASSRAAIARTSAAPFVARVPRRAAWAVAGMALAGIAWFAGRTSATTVPSGEATREQVVLWKTDLPSILSPGAPLVAQQAALSPDGATIVYTDSTPRGWMLFRKRATEEDAQPLEGTENGVAPFFSPDGRWIGFLNLDGTLFKIATDGGRSVKLADPGNGNHIYLTGTWLDTDSIVYSDGTGGMLVVSASGGPTRRLAASRQLGVASLSALPGGRAFLFVRCALNCALGSNAHLFDLETGRITLIAPDVTGVWYHPDGVVLTAGRNGGLFATPFDAASKKATGALVSLSERVASNQLSLSQGGDMVYLRAPRDGATRSLVWVDDAGRTTPVDSSWKGWFEYPALSPDGARLAVSVRGNGFELWIRKADGTRVRVRSTDDINWRPSWSADGRTLLFISAPPDRSDSNRVMSVDADGSGQPVQVFRTVASTWEAEYSSDGNWLAYRSDDAQNASNIRARRRDDTTVVVDLAATPASEVQLAVSPDGKWIAFTSNETGRLEVYVTDFPGAKARRMVSRDGAYEPRWSRDGRSLFFVSSGTLAKVNVGADPTRESSAPQSLFSLDGFARARNRPEYDIAPDGRFLMIKEPPVPLLPPVVHVRHWRPALTGAKAQ